MGWEVNPTPRQLHPRERDPVPIVSEAAWAWGSVWTGAGFDPRTVQPVPSRYIDWTTPAYTSNVGLYGINWKVQLLYWPWDHFCVLDDELFPKITFWMIQLAELVDYCFLFNICSGTHENEAWNSRSLCQVLTSRLDTRNSQLARSGLLVLVGVLQIYDFLSDRGTTTCSLEIPVHYC
jgi:hypothetical protein